jgi:early secretory antigenic target protein ESAT-6
MSGNRDLKVGYEALDGAASDIKSAALAIEDKLTQLEKRMEGRMPEWTGEASASFREARIAWDKAMNDMKDVLNDIGLTVGLSNEEYKRAESANAKRFGIS